MRVKKEKEEKEERRMKRLKVLQLMTLLTLLILPLFATSAATACAPCEPLTVNLIAGGGNPKSAMCIGNVIVWNDFDHLYVKYVITRGGWCIEETHLQVSTSLSGIPGNNGNPTPGRFDYKTVHGCVTEYTYSVPLAWCPGTTVYIAAHAVVKPCGGCGNTETAWGAGCEFPGKNWAMYFCYTIQSCLTIDEPTNGNVVYGEWVQCVSGHFCGTLPSGLVWILTRPTDSNCYWPQCEIDMLDDGTWYNLGWVNVAGEQWRHVQEFEIVVAIVTTATDTLYEHRLAVGDYSPIVLQPGTIILNSVTITRIL